MRRFVRHLLAWFRRGQLDDDMRDELAQHVAWKTQALIDDRVPEIEARRQAARAVGNITRLKEEARDMWGFPALDTVLQDLRWLLVAGLQAGRGSVAARYRGGLAAGLVITQIALSMVLVATAALLVRSVRNLQHVDLGFNPRNVLLFRMDALGADRSAVAWMILRQSLVLAASGLLLGSVGAALGTTTIESLLYQMPARDPTTLAGAAAIMLVVSAVAGYLPARRAARVDPLVSLRHQ